MAGPHRSGECLFRGTVPAELLRRFRVAAGDHAGSIAYAGAIARGMMIEPRQRSAEFSACMGWMVVLPRQGQAEFQAYLPASLLTEWWAFTEGSEIVHLRLAAALHGAVHAKPLQSLNGRPLSVGESLTRWFACWEHDPQILAESHRLRIGER